MGFWGLRFGVGGLRVWGQGFWRLGLGFWGLGLGALDFWGLGIRFRMNSGPRGFPTRVGGFQQLRPCPASLEVLMLVLLLIEIIVKLSHGSPKGAPCKGAGPSFF